MLMVPYLLPDPYGLLLKTIEALCSEFEMSDIRQVTNTTILILP